jgi:N-acyl-D-aspartate/D-glutamate deacylase
MTFDLIIRNGTVVDGLGEPQVGDVAVSDTTIVSGRAS